MSLTLLSLEVLWVCLLLGDFSSQSCVGEQSLVCGEDGVTYANECYAKKAKKDIVRVGPCLESRKCRCNRLMDDVCGSNGIQYYNACLARCHGVEEYTYGKCGDGV
ncbi:uncharacterized protein LOC111133805 [Crassostrea virginica]